MSWLGKSNVVSETRAASLPLGSRFHSVSDSPHIRHESSQAVPLKDGWLGEFFDEGSSNMPALSSIYGDLMGSMMKKAKPKPLQEETSSVQLVSGDNSTGSILDDSNVEAAQVVEKTHSRTIKTFTGNSKQYIRIIIIKTLTICLFLFHTATESAQFRKVLGEFLQNSSRKTSATAVLEENIVKAPAKNKKSKQSIDNNNVEESSSAVSKKKRSKHA